MAVLLVSKADSYIQLISMLVILVFVLGTTAFVTRWIAGYQKQQGANCNIEIIETTRLSNNKYIQIVRIGDTYKSIAVSKDNVTFLGDIPKEEIKISEVNYSLGFKEVFDKVLKKSDDNDDLHKD